MSATMEITNSRFRQLAKDLYQDEGRIEIDDNAIVSRGVEPVEGAYVQAWVWVGVEDEDDDEAVQTDKCADNILHPTDSCPTEA